MSLARWPLLPLYLTNIGANLAGVLILGILNLFTPMVHFEQHRTFLMLGSQAGGSLYLLAFLVGFISAYRTKRPIARVLALQRQGLAVPAALLQRARRRLLNLPFILAGTNFLIWVCASVLFSLLYRRLDQAPMAMVLLGVFHGLMIGLITTGLSFFLIENVARRRLVAVFFPDGQEAISCGSVRMSVVRRIRYLMGAGTLNPLLMLVGAMVFRRWEMGWSGEPISPYGQALLVFLLVLCALYLPVTMGLNMLVSRSILEPIRAMMRQVAAIDRGDLQQQVQVMSNDELGQLAAGMNEMTRGLRERQRLQHALNLAKEVQQALLPAQAPQVPGLDIAGASLYCDETGGDYFDFLPSSDGGANALTLVVGDVAGHGVATALLMASCRAYLRQRCAAGGTLAAIAEDVNAQLSRDLAYSASFMTLLLMRVMPATGRLCWVRGGHEPALLLDPRTGQFYDLRGEGAALGLDPAQRFSETWHAGFGPGQILMLGTDGIWEARDERGEMFGRSRLQRLVIELASGPAQGIVDGVFEALRQFRGSFPAEDDATLIVVKSLDAPGQHGSSLAGLDGQGLPT